MNQGHTMKCFHCGSPDLRLAPLSAAQKRDFAGADLVLRLCHDCGFYQNHVGLDEPLDKPVASSPLGLLRRLYHAFRR